MALRNGESAIERKARVPYDWRLVKVEQKSMCGEEWVKEEQIETCGVFYLIDANTHVHICSFTPNLEAWPMHAYVTFEEGKKVNSWGEDNATDIESELLSSEEACSYFGTEVLANCPHKPATDYIDFPEPEEGETDEKYRMRCADELREYLCGNPAWF